MSSEGALKTLYENNQAAGDGAPPAKKSKKAPPAFPVFDGGDVKQSKAANKRLSVERIYQKKSQLEHILLRPDTYIGSVETVTQQMWVLDEDTNKMETREITYVPGLYKIFDEIIVNAADNKVRDPSMDTMKIDIDSESNKIRVWNNGKGIPVVEHKTEKMYVPTMIFGHLLTSSNYDDSEKKVTGGRNGFGAKLCNIFSTKFIVETSSRDDKRSFKQTWTDNMGKTKEPTISDAKDKDFTCVTFSPDLGKFGMTSLNKDIVALFTRRAYDVAGATQGVRVFLNGKKLPVKNFRDYMDLYLKDKLDEAGQPVKVVHERVNPRWEVAITLSDRGFQQVSFVNSIATTKGGRHVDYVADQCISKLIEIIKKKNKDGIKIMPFQVKNHLWVFVNCLVENPTFDSQTKENMTKQAKSFGSKCQLSENFVKQVNKCGIVESVLSWMKFKAQTQLNKKCLSTKHSKLKGIPKLDDANDAGTKNSDKCTLILTEGDSAKTLAVAGLGVIGRDKYGVFPLRGKLLNVREATHKQIMDNAEINNVIKIMGLHFKEKYETAEQLRTLRYGKLMIMTDQDQDGSHIKGLLVNFIHHFWPNLLRHNIVEEFITPIVKVTKGKTEESFFSLPEFEEWKSNTNNWHTWKIKYYKGLGTSTSKEAKEYFSDMPRHRIPFRYGGGEDDSSINLAFSKKKVDERKEWLSNYMEERKRRTDLDLPELYLYTKDTRHITYSEFINRELILFSNADNVRSIPSLMDGLKPGQRKVIFTCIKRNLTQKELKVAQLAGSVAEQSAYHHGEGSLMSTIINLAQNFVGSNNLNMLQPIGQFGTRLHGGKDAASPRYIFTMLSPLARMVVNSKDDALLRHLSDDNQRIEPEWYCPILPMVLVNGADGIGTGWSTKVPNYDIRGIVNNLRRLLQGQEPLPMVPSFKNFRGTIEELGENRFICSGEILVIDDSTVEITELPVRTWSQTYKEEVLEPLLMGTDKTPALITDYKDYNTDTTVKFVVKMTPEKLAQAEQTGLHKVFKLQSNLSTNMVLFDNNGCIKKYSRVEEILREFFAVRVDFYHRRKVYLEGMLTAESLKLDNIARFILEKIEGTIVIENKPKREIIQTLVRRGYDSDPVKDWKEAQKKDKEDYIEEEEEGSSVSSATAAEDKGAPDFNYILNLPMWCLTKERKDELLKQGESKREELQELRKKSPSDMWNDDLDELIIALDEVEQKEREDMKMAGKPAKQGKVGKLKSKKAIEQIQPSPVGRRIQPRIDSATKMRAEKADARKTKGPKSRKGKLLLEEGVSENTNDEAVTVKEEDTAAAEPEPEPLSLAQRLKLASDMKAKMTTSEAAPAAAAAKEKKPRKPAGTTQGRPAKGGSGGSPAKGKKGKKRGAWSDFEDDEDMIDASSEDDDIAGPTVAQSRGPRRAAANKAKFAYDDSDDDFVVEDDSDEEFSPESFKPSVNKAKAAPAATDENDDEDSPIRAAPKRKFAGLSDDDDDDKEECIPAQTAKGATKKAVVSCSDSDDSFTFEAEEKPAPAKAKAKPAAKKATAKAAAKPAGDAVVSAACDGASKDKDESSDMPEPVSKPAAKKASTKPPAAKKAKKGDGDSKPKKGKGKQGHSSDSDAEDMCAPKKKRTLAKKAAKKDSDCSDMDDMDAVPAPRRAPTRRAKAPVKDNFDDSMEDFDDDF